MDEQALNFKHRRKPLLAAFLSFISIGLGYVYCGRIVRGLVTAFICAIFLPHIYYGIIAGFSQVNLGMIKAILVLSLISIIIWIAVIIDSFLIAKKSNPVYELKEYNRWYVYLIFYFLIISSARNLTSDMKANLIEAFRESTFSMYPAIEHHDCFLVNKKAYKKIDPQRGDIIVFVYPEDRHVDYVKRVVAVAGDTVEMKNNQLIVNGEQLEKVQLYTATYADKDANNNDVNVDGTIFVEKNHEAKYEIFLMDTYGSVKSKKWRPDFPETKIPKNHCFVLGDNRNLSRDSRDYGSIPLSTVKGRAEYLYWPSKDWSRFGPLK
jgi:signal peptidase I